MPNHITTEVTSSNAVIQSMLNDEGLVDFCEVIPCHKDLELDGADGISCAAESAAKLMCQDMPKDDDLTARLQMVNMLRGSALIMSDDCFEQFVMMMRNRRNHGFYHMMDYARNAWGTKWNAYGQSAEQHTPNQVKFETAWSHPFPVIKALSKKFPEDDISIRFADEDTGSNCGIYTIRNGEMLTSDIAPNWGDQSDADKKKWTEFAFRLRYPDADPREYGYNENWQYDEDVENAYYEANAK